MYQGLLIAPVDIATYLPKVSYLGHPWNKGIVYLKHVITAWRMKLLDAEGTPGVATLEQFWRGGSSICARASLLHMYVHQNPICCALYETAE